MVDLPASAFKSDPQRFRICQGGGPIGVVYYDERGHKSWLEIVWEGESRMTDAKALTDKYAAETGVHHLLYNVVYHKVNGKEQVGGLLCYDSVAHRGEATDGGCPCTHETCPDRGEATDA